ncbi:response regulator [Chitinophagaceae bacterium LWZ2-11]
MAKIKLLLVDDEKPLLNNFRQILELENFDVAVAGNGKEGIEQFYMHKPDMIICDIMMPDMDGYAFITKIRENGHTDVPFVFLTAKSDYDDIRTGMNLGADDYLVKPVKGSQLIETIHTRLQRKREINKHLEKELLRLENSFKLLSDQEFFAYIYDLISYLNVLKSKYALMEPTSVEEYIGYMEKSTGRLLELLKKVKYWRDNKNGLLTPDKYNSSSSKMQHILLEITNNAAKKYNREKDLICDVKEDALLALNEELLHLLLSELLDNAFKFSDKGNPVVVGATVSAGNCVIMVADCGKTTNAESIMLAKPFDRKNTRPGNDPGLGLGLAIAELITQSVGGEMSFKNNSPCGILVTLKIPTLEKRKISQDDSINKVYEVETDR